MKVGGLDLRHLLGLVVMTGYAGIVAAAFLLMEANPADPFRGFAAILLTLPSSAVLTLLILALSQAISSHSWFDTSPRLAEVVIVVSGFLNLGLLSWFFFLKKRKAASQS
jgi:ABC-type proline/glycine betaine transport system permease subunit